jgi:hypothetical protein
MLSIHVGADQLAQWLDGYACKQSEEFLKIPLETRHYMSLLFLEDEIGMVKRTGDSDHHEVEYWDISDGAPPAWRSKRANIRRLIHHVDVVSNRQMSKYAEVLSRGLSRKITAAKCIRMVGTLIFMIDSGDVELIGWDKIGRLEFRVISEATGMPANGIFQSAIALLETGRFHTEVE